MVLPRTITDFSRGTDAGMETARREGMGTANHSMVGVYGTLAGLALAAGIIGIYKFGNNDVKANEIFADSETLDLHSKIFNEKLKAASQGDSKANPIREYLTETFKRYETLSPTENSKWIKLDDEARAAGGLKIIGTERHESRRIDNQLRGRAGRQGDPGESQFFISLEDDLMRLFGSERLMGVFNALGVPEGEQIQHKMLTSAIEKAQEKIEANNFGIRKNLLEYDQVDNDQREIIYSERMKVLNGDNMRDAILKMVQEQVEKSVDRCISEEIDRADWDLVELNELVLPVIPLDPITKEDIESIKNAKQLKQYLKEKAVMLYEQKETEFPEPAQFREIERVVLLRVIDRKWMDHIDDMAQLRQGIGLQAYGQKDPIVEYKMAGFDMFDDMISAIQEDTVRLLYHVQVEQKVEREQVAKISGTNKDESAQNAPKRRAAAKVYPNDPCPCGSGKKYKQCCGRVK